MYNRLTLELIYGNILRYTQTWQKPSATAVLYIGISVAGIVYTLFSSHLVYPVLNYTFFMS